MGVIAEAPASKGQIIWKAVRELDQLFPVSFVDTLPGPARATILHFAYRSVTLPDYYILEFDNGRFMNHSENANLDFSQDDIGIATRDIAAGEELTCDYRQFCLLDDYAFLNA